MTTQYANELFWREKLDSRCTDTLDYSGKGRAVYRPYANEVSLTGNSWTELDGGWLDHHYSGLK